jgi:hypothetical protein
MLILVYIYIHHHFFNGAIGGCLQGCNNPLLWLQSKDVEGCSVILVFLPLQVHLMELPIDVIYVSSLYYFICQ